MGLSTTSKPEPYDRQTMKDKTSLPSHLTWDDRLLVGDAELDRQHKLLFAMIDKLWAFASAEANEWAVCDILCQIDEYLKKHVKLEEGIMASTSLPLSAEHTAEHRRLLHNLKNLTEAYENGRPFVLPKILELLSGWLYAHVSVWDKELGKHISSGK